MQPKNVLQNGTKTFLVCKKGEESEEDIQSLNRLHLTSVLAIFNITKKPSLAGWRVLASFAYK
jgi:hypothetical protein